MVDPTGRPARTARGRGGGLAYDLLTLVHQLPAAIETVRALPGTMFVLDHLAKPPIAAGDREPWASHIRELAAEPNVTASCRAWSPKPTGSGRPWRTRPP